MIDPTTCIHTVQKNDIGTWQCSECDAILPPLPEVFWKTQQGNTND